MFEFVLTFRDLYLLIGGLLAGMLIPDVHEYCRRTKCGFTTKFLLACFLMLVMVAYPVVMVLGVLAYVVGWLWRKK